MVILSAGMCFGEWGLLDKVNRSTSAFAYEDTDLFMLNSKDFGFAFQV